MARQIKAKIIIFFYILAVITHFDCCIVPAQLSCLQFDSHYVNYDYISGLRQQLV